MYKHEDSRSISISSLSIAKKNKEKENSSYFLACPAYSYELTLVHAYCQKRRETLFFSKRLRKHKNALLHRILFSFSTNTSEGKGQSFKDTEALAEVAVITATQRCMENPSAGVAGHALQVLGLFREYVLQTVFFIHMMLLPELSHVIFFHTPSYCHSTLLERRCIQYQNIRTSSFLFKSHSMFASVCGHLLHPECFVQKKWGVKDVRDNIPV